MVSNVSDISAMRRLYAQLDAIDYEEVSYVDWPGNDLLALALFALSTKNP